MHRMKREKVLLYLLLIAGCLTAFTPAVCSADGRVNYTYIPEDKIGEFRVYVDDMRYLRGSYKGVNLLHRWGETWSKQTFWGFRSKREIYHPGNVNDRVWEYLVPDLPVRVTKGKGRVEYLWGRSYRLGDSGRKLHLQADMKHLNRMVVRKDRITVTSTLEFQTDPKRKVIFYPVIFPGRGKNRKYIKEFRILGKECVVIDKDGKTQNLIYPKEVKAQVWGPKDPRSIIFEFDDLGKVRYNFRFSDPDVSVMFYAHTGWPSPSLNPFACPALVPKIVLPVREKVKNGPYRCTMEMEVVVGSAVNKQPMDITSVPHLPLEEHVDITVETARPSYRFLEDDPLKFNFIMDGLAANAKRNLTIDVAVRNYENREVRRQKLSITLPDDSGKDLTLSLPTQDKGAYLLDATVLEGKKVVGWKGQRFCVLHKPYPYPSEKSYFGCSSGGIKYIGPSKEAEEWCSLLYDLGIKMLRWRAGWEFWDKKDKRYTFGPEKYEKFEIARRAGLGGFLTEVGGTEDYWCELAKRMKDMFGIFELDNERNLVRYQSEKERQEHIEKMVEFYAECYRGIKRGNPDALVEGGTLGCTEIKDLKWLEEILARGKDKHGKILDIMAPHYLLRSFRPERCLELLKLAREVAEKYNLILWNGENGLAYDSFHNTYPNSRFIKQEREFANATMRDYLLEKMYGVKQVNACHAAGSYYSPWSLSVFEYEGPNAGIFFGRGGFIKPWAVAHAALARLLEGAKFTTRIEKGFGDFYCLVFKRNDETMAAVWMVEGAGELRMVLPGGIERWNIVGGVKKVAPRQSFTITEEPFYLVANGRAGEGLIKALKDSTFLPDRVIEIEKSRFTSGNRVLEVDVRNYWSVPLTIDSARIEHEDGKVVVEKVTIPGGKVTPVRFDLKEQLNPRGIWIDVAINVKGKEFKKEFFVRYMPATVKEAVAEGYLVAVRAKGAVTIDGNLSEWKYAVPIELNSKSQVIYDELKAEDLGGWSGPEDLSGTGYVMWDKENFYFACKVTDDVYQNLYPEGKASTWNCDSIQMAFDPLMTGKATDQYYTDGHQEINLSLTVKGPVYLGRVFGTKYSDRIKRNVDGQIAGAKVAVKKWAKGLIYEFSMPLGELYPLKVGQGTVTRFNFIINEDDGRGREMWIGITPGIGEKKRPALFRKLMFL